MLHPNTVLRFINEEMGYGVFATKRIPAGTIVYVKDQLEIEIDALNPLLQDPRYATMIEKYSYVEADGNRVLSWDFSRFVNHSCEPNILSTSYGFEIAVVDIQPGREICDDYGMLNIEQEMRCLCGAQDCRGAVQPDDLLRHARRWNGLLKSAFANLNGVAQPLWEYIDESSKRSILAGKRPQSVASLYYPKNETAGVETTIERELSARA